MPNKENIERFEQLMYAVKRDGIDKLMEYVRKSDFYTAPASSKFHLACEGGLLQHSLNVYDCLIAKRKSPVWGPVLEKVSEESLIIIALMHDLCKTFFYLPGSRNQKTYDPEKVAKAEAWQVKTDKGGYFIWESVPSYSIDDKMPLGHGEKSVMLLQEFIKLEKEEIYAIRWHMGFSEEKSQYFMLGAAMEKYPVVLALYEADLEASKLLESKDK